jgi:undecaprenyl-diphosphatase
VTIASAGGVTQALHDFAVSHSWLTLPVIVITAACIALCPIALIVLWIRTRTLRPLLATLLGLVIADITNHRIGNIQFHPRPFVALHFTPLFPHNPSTSFPSSTVAFATVAATVVLLTWRPLGFVLMVGTAIIAFGCVYVGVHWPSDVLVGALLGFACGAVAWLALGVPPVARLLTRVERQLPGARRST